MVKKICAQGDLTSQVGQQVAHVQPFVDAHVATRHQAGGRADPNAGQTAGSAPGLAERALRPELASVHAPPSRNQHRTLWERAASEFDETGVIG